MWWKRKGQFVLITQHLHIKWCSQDLIPLPSVWMKCMFSVAVSDCTSSRVSNFVCMDSTELEHSYRWNIYGTVESILFVRHKTCYTWSQWSVDLQDIFCEARLRFFRVVPLFNILIKTYYILLNYFLWQS